MIPNKIIKNKEVDSVLKYEELINVFRDTFISYQKGESIMPVESKIYTEKGDFVSMPARVNIDRFDYCCVKWISWFGENKTIPPILGNLLLNDPENGECECIIEAEELTAYRTGAIAGLTTD